MERERNYESSLKDIKVEILETAARLRGLSVRLEHILMEMRWDYYDSQVEDQADGFAS